WVNNLLPYANLDRRINFKSFSDLNWRGEWQNTYQTSSVGRRLSDIFWRTLPWEKIEGELGEIHIFDTGCGHGNYGARLYNASGGKVASYTGVDAKARPNWKELEKKYPNFHFIESRSSNVSELVPQGSNLFITQSAIEHFDEDIKFFEQIKNYVENRDEPTIQVHIFPAAATLPLYLLHGLRQYTPRTVSKITRIFSDSSKFYLYGLGGRSAWKVHWKYFTWPVLIARKFGKPTFDESEYDKDLVEAVHSDMQRPSNSPIFWALIIHSKPRAKVW
ncbi:MAG: hypothetical protein NUV78_02680, partial [Candidatus Zambryskibacteria bacterium]|nr:hypothetical protein [Candidatus Zambryskibacteria bacterium]